MSLALGPPPPRVHDEFSYLLAGDTFALGRVANPTHAMWTHFETFHVLQTPSYASKYPPAPGLFLAIGQVLTGSPIVGVWLSLGLAAAAIGWMLRGWFSPGWAFLGAILAQRPYLVVGWGDSYWGGGVPLLGGALVLGAVPRLFAEPRPVHGLALVGGLLVLASSRPYEGLLASMVPTGAVLLRLWRGRRDRTVTARCLLVVPSMLLLGIGGAALAYYNARVTGSPWQVPYAAYEAQYSYVPVFGWEELGTPPAYRHEIFRRYYREYGEHTFSQTSVVSTRWRFKQTLESHVWRWYLGSALTLPVIVSMWRPRGDALVGLLVCALVVVGNLAAAWVWPHYFAPAAPALYLLVTLGLRKLSMLAFRRVRVGVALVVLLVGGAMWEAAGQYPLLLRAARSNRVSWAQSRVRLEAELAREPELDLVLVRYARHHNVHDEWVYNRAAIDAAPVVWAREMDEASNHRLLEYFRDRKAWLLLADERPVRLVAHESPGSRAALPRTPRAAGSGKDDRR